MKKHLEEHLDTILWASLCPSGVAVSVLELIG